MRLSLQTLTQKIFFLFLLTLIYFINNQAFAAQFRVKSPSGKTSTIKSWTDPSIWEKRNNINVPWADANALPTATDNVLIDDGNLVEILVPIVEMLTLTVYAPDNTSNPKTLLDAHSSNVRVYGNIVVTNGATQGNTRIAEIIINNNGVLEATGDITPNANTSPVNPNNRITIIGNGLVISGSIINPLPVELTAFNAVKKNADVVLTWETASEKNCKGFEIQAAADGKNYEALDFVASLNGNTATAQRYAYTHKIGKKEGLMYYRLKQIDMDGTVVFSQAKVVDLGRLTYTASVYPNPFQDAFKVNLETQTAQTAEVLVTDITGKTLYTTETNLAKGSNLLDINLSQQTPGLYLLKVTTGNQTYINRLVKQ